jgi:hypothetical protein
MAADLSSPAESQPERVCLRCGTAAGPTQRGPRYCTAEGYTGRAGLDRG